MPSPLTWPCGDTLRRPCAGLLAMLVVCAPAPCLASDEAYLELLDAEATKVEPDATDKQGNSASSGPQLTERETESLASREQFEVLLRQENVGTYSFYRKLPERSREEVFLDYRNGASMEALRGKVVNRYLNP